VVLTLRTQPNAIVVPSQAVQTGQQGQFVFVIKPDMTVDARQVVVARSGDGQAVIEKGLNAGENVVTDGQLRLVPGSRVEIKQAIAPPAAPGPNQARPAASSQQPERQSVAGAEAVQS
jgi:membrane fusion protein, multidrug efflux system